MVAANLSDQLELADGESGAAAVSVVVGKRKTAADPAKLADSADADKDALKPSTKLQHDNDYGVRLRVDETKLKEQGDSGIHLKESPKEQRKLRQGHAILVPHRKEHWIPLEDDKKRPTNNSHQDSGSNYNNVDGNLYSNGGCYGYSDYAGTEAEKVVSANETEQKNANADSAVPASESARESEDFELYLHKTRLQEVLLEKEYLIRQLEYAEKQLKMVKDENKQLFEENKKLQRLKYAKKQLKIVEDENKQLYDENKKLQAIHVVCSAESDISKTILELLAKCHNIFLCPHEVGFKKLQDYLSGSNLALLCVIKIPGAEELKFDRINKMTPLCKVIFLGMIEIVYCLHRNGLSLGGNFLLNDFYWTLDQKVKIAANVKKFVSKRNWKNMKLDYRRLRKLMLKLLEGCNIGIPADLEYLFDLMRSSNSVKHQELIRYNFCLMDDISKREYTITLFTEMEKLDKEDYEKFGNSYGKYRTYSALSFITVPVGWGKDVCGNKFVKKIYEKMRLDQRQHWIVGRHGIGQTKQFVKFMCHSLVHLPDHAFDEYRKTHFDDTQVVDMVQVHTPCVFSQFQRGMHKIKKLAYPHLIRIMQA